MSPKKPPVETHIPAFPPGIDVAFREVPFGTVVWEAVWTHLPRKGDLVELGSEKYVVKVVQWRQHTPITAPIATVFVAIQGNGDE